MTSYLRQKLQSFQITSSSPSKEEDDVNVKEGGAEEEEVANTEKRDEIERSKIGIMRALIQAQDPSAKVNPPKLQSFSTLCQCFCPFHFYCVFYLSNDCPMFLQLVLVYYCQIKLHNLIMFFSVCGT